MMYCKHAHNKWLQMGRKSGPAADGGIMGLLLAERRRYAGPAAVPAWLLASCTSR